MPKTDSLPNSVVVHPLVLLSAVDHFTRLGTGPNQRVVGVLLGMSTDGVVDVTNSYAGT
jgi:26S proteasome regulatory subunit N8